MHAAEACVYTQDAPGCESPASPRQAAPTVKGQWQGCRRHSCTTDSAARAPAGDCCFLAALKALAASSSASCSASRCLAASAAARSACTNATHACMLFWALLHKTTSPDVRLLTAASSESCFVSVYRPLLLLLMLSVTLWASRLSIRRRNQPHSQECKCLVISTFRHVAECYKSSTALACYLHDTTCVVWLKHLLLLPALKADPLRCIRQGRASLKSTRKVSVWLAMGQARARTASPHDHRVRALPRGATHMHADPGLTITKAPAHLDLMGDSC